MSASGDTGAAWCHVGKLSNDILPWRHLAKICHVNFHFWERHIFPLEMPEGCCPPGPLAAVSFSSGQGGLFFPNRL